MLLLKPFALSFFGLRDMKFTVPTRQFQVKCVVAVFMYPVLGVAKLTEQGLKVKFGQQERPVGINDGSDAVSVESRR